MHAESELHRSTRKDDSISSINHQVKDDTKGTLQERKGSHKYTPSWEKRKQKSKLQDECSIHSRTCYESCPSFKKDQKNDSLLPVALQCGTKEQKALVPSIEQALQQMGFIRRGEYVEWGKGDHKKTFNNELEIAQYIIKLDFSTLAELYSLSCKQLDLLTTWVADCNGDSKEGETEQEREMEVEEVTNRMPAKDEAVKNVATKSDHESSEQKNKRLKGSKVEYECFIASPFDPIAQSLPEPSNILSQATPQPLTFEDMMDDLSHRNEEKRGEKRKAEEGAAEYVPLCNRKFYPSEEPLHGSIVAQNMASRRV